MERLIRTSEHQDMPVLCPGTAPSIKVTDGGKSVVLDPNNYTTIRVWATDDCFIKFGASPTAVEDTDIPLSGGISENFIVRPGWSVSVVGATLYITVHMGE